MKILHLSYWDLSGGAARAANRLHEGLRQAGVASQMLVEAKTSHDDCVIQHIAPSGIEDRIYRKFRRWQISKSIQKYQSTKPLWVEVFSDDRTGHGSLLLGQLPKCDVIHLHWVSGLVDIGENLIQLAEIAPLVWTLHDMNPMTGGCHYDMKCARYLEDCGQCPQLGSKRQADLSRQIFHRKRNVFTKLGSHQMTVVTPSRWLGECAQKSPLLSKFPVKTIPNGLNIKDFAPRDKYFSRDILGIPREAKVILFIADSLSHKRKGCKLLFEALEQLKNISIYCITVGNDSLPPPPGARIFPLGRIKSDRQLSLAYSAADISICPSIEDNSPNTILESLACGTPCIGFNIGGIPDLIIPGITGWIANETTSDNLAKTILKAFEAMNCKTSISRIGTESRRIAKERFSLETQANSYINLYKQVCNPKTKFSAT